MRMVKGYEPLRNVLQAAFDQASEGKGRERHADNRPFAEQPIMTIQSMHGIGIGGGLYQVIKKTNEAGAMAQRNEIDAAERELLGAINYAASVILMLRKQK